MNWFNKHKNKLGLLGVFVFIQMVLINPVFAQGLGFSNPAGNDMSIQFLDQIFGGLINNGSDAFGDSIGVFNGAILTIGGILAAYTILAGTIGTAHDGEMLGKKFSSIWIPIRYSLGTALVLPILTGGYCIMQALVMWIVMQGIALANITWASYVAKPSSLMVAKIGAKGDKAIEEVVKQAYLANVCVFANKKAIDEAPSILGLSLVNRYDKVKDGTIGWNFGNQFTPFTKNNCGTVVYPIKPPVSTTSTAPTGTVSSVSGISTLYKNIDTTPIWQEHITQTDIVVNQTATLAQAAINNPESVSYSQLQALINNYKTAIQSSGSGVVAGANGNAGLVAAATQQGWFLAGSWFTKLINAQNTVNSAASDISSGQGKMAAPTSVISKEATTYMSRANLVLANSDPNSRLMAENPNGQQQTVGSQSSDTGAWGSIAQWLAQTVTSIRLDEVRNDTRHPLILMNEIGGRMMTTFTVALVSAAGIFGLASFKVFGTGVDLTALAVILSTFLIFPLAIFFTTGATLSYVLPNLPFLIWIGIIIGWVIMVVEAIIAAPLWAVMHLHPNGDDLTGRGGNGYMMVLGLLLRPVLIVFGFIASIVLSGLFGEFVNKVFFDVFASSQLNGTIGFFSMIAGTALYAVIMYTLFTKTLSLMHVIPDQLLRWIGGGGEQLGQYAGGFSGDGMAKAGAALGGVTGYVAKEGISTGTQSMGQMKQISAANKGAKEQAKGNEIAKQSAYAQGESTVGAGYSSVASQIDSNSGGSVEGARDKATFTSSSESLGGKNSEEASGYRARVAESMGQGKSFSEAHNSAYPKSVDEKFGAGSFSAAEKLGESGGNLGSPGYKAQFDRAINSFSSKLNDYQKIGQTPDEARETLSGVLNKAIQNSESNGASLGVSLKDASNEKNIELGISKSPKVEPDTRQGNLDFGGNGGSAVAAPPNKIDTP